MVRFYRTIRLVLLSGWKEIAGHLRCGVRTAQRWAANGLPIKRIGRGPRAHVMADSEAIDRWVRHGGRLQMENVDAEELIRRSGKLLNEINELRNSLQQGVRSLHQGIAALRDKQATQRALRTRTRRG